VSALRDSDREDALRDLLARAGWGDAQRRPLAGDASSRRYERLVRGSDSAVLMDAPSAAEAPSCPPEADPAERKRLGYNAMARLAGPNLAAFAGLARELTARGYSAPQIIAADFAAGYLLLEDLGDALFARILDQGADAEPLYAAAIDLLGAVRRATVPETVAYGGKSWRVQAYDATALQAEADLLVEWYAVHRAGVRLDEAALADWRALWAEAFKALEGEASTLVLRDVHAENLIWLPEREGPARAGLLDFQDALFGHAAYDLVSLLQDARRDVDPALEAAMMARFVEVGAVDDQAGFARAYAILGAQRNAKILGIFVRLAHRDGKQRYLGFLPRVARLFLRDLDHPVFADLKAWTGKHLPSLGEEARG
jgi:aminoglycoside/choline kinase family phosphotransferase